MSNLAMKEDQPLIVGDPLTDANRAEGLIEIHFGDTQVVITSADGSSVLEVLLASGLKPPHSCKNGVCMACIAVIESGTVRLKKMGSLSEEEAMESKVLTCQAIPMSKKLKVHFVG